MRRRRRGRLGAQARDIFARCAQDALGQENGDEDEEKAEREEPEFGQGAGEPTLSHWALSRNLIGFKNNSLSTSFFNYSLDLSLLNLLNHRHLIFCFFRVVQLNNQRQKLLLVTPDWQEV